MTNSMRYYFKQEHSKKHYLINYYLHLLCFKI